MQGVDYNYNNGEEVDMERTGELRYRVECIRCGRRFIVKDILSPVPKHPPKGQPVKPHSSVRMQLI